MPNLTAKFIQHAKPGKHCDGQGLYLVVADSGARSWVLRVQVNGRRRDIGLGGAELINFKYPSAVGDDIPLEQRRRLRLAEARELSARLRNAAKAGRDPVAERRRDRITPPSFREAATATHAAQSHGWSQRTADAFLSSLREHVFPLLGRKRVDTITAEDVASVLTPIWSSKPAMAKKVRQRIATVLDYSAAKNWRATEAPRHQVRALTGKPKTGKHFPAMPYPQLPDYFRALGNANETVGRLALMFLIATAARSTEVREACWCHIDFDRAEWRRPASLMRKSNEEHVVTLNNAALAVLERISLIEPSNDPGDLIFKNRKSKMLSDMTISKIMRDGDLPWVPHGFRSTFRDWAAEQRPDIPDPVAEAALSHTVPDAVVKAYKRTKFLEMRRVLLDHWSDFLLAPSTTSD